MLEWKEVWLSEHWRSRQAKVQNLFTLTVRPAGRLEWSATVGEDTKTISCKSLQTAKRAAVRHAILELECALVDLRDELKILRRGIKQHVR